MSSTRVLITNDDGIAAEGIRRLALLAHESGYDVVVAAPKDNASGASASLTAIQDSGRVEVEARPLAGLDGVPSYAVHASPAFIALIATRGAFGPPPDFVLSGINAGHNAGQAVLHSGTVGAALTAASQGIPAMAVSLIVPSGDDGAAPEWDTATLAASMVLDEATALPPGTVVNLNVPAVAPGALKGVRRAHLASFGAVRTQVLEAGAGFVHVAMVDQDAELEPGTDAGLLAEGWATVTGLHPICEADVALPALA